MTNANKWFPWEENQRLDLKQHCVRRSPSFMLRSAPLLCFVSFSVANTSHERLEEVDFKADSARWSRRNPSNIWLLNTFFFFFAPFWVNVGTLAWHTCVFRLERFEHHVVDSAFQKLFTRKVKQTEIMTRLLCKSSYLTISKCHGGASVTNY